MLSRAPRPGNAAGSARGRGAPSAAAGLRGAGAHHLPAPPGCPHPVPEAGTEQGEEPGPVRWDPPGDGRVLHAFSLLR